MKKILDILFSTRLMGVLFVVFFIAIGSATFVEEAYDTVTAKILIYDSFWLEMVMMLMVVNFMGNIVRYNLLRFEKIGTLTFHLAFIVVIIGAGITRYTGYEGLMPIREGETSNIMYSAEPFLQVHISDLKERHTYDKLLYLSDAPVVDNSFDMEVQLKENDPLKITYKKFIKNAIERIKENQPNGNDMLQIVLGGQEGRENLYIKKGEVVNLGEIAFAYENFENENAIQITQNNEDLLITSPVLINRFSMPGFVPDTIFPNTPKSFKPMHLHRFGQTQFVFKANITKGVRELEKGGPSEKGTDALIVDIEQGDRKEEKVLFGGISTTPAFQEYAHNGLLYKIGYGAKPIRLPFSVKCKDFIFDTYPGTEMPMSYRSEVTVFDDRNNLVEDHSIFMNNVLDYSGFRFFQSSFDPDRKGTRLSVNHDFWGTWVTYIGYILLGIGFFLALIMKQSRFRQLGKKIIEIDKNQIASVLILGFGLFFSTEGFSQKDNQIHHVSVEHAEKLGRVLVLAQNGRYEPIHTLAYDFAHKIARKEKFELEDGSIINPMQLFADILANPQYWRDQKIIYLKRNTGIQKILGIETNEKYASFMNFFGDHDNYKLAEQAGQAWNKDQGKRNLLDKELIKADEKMRIMFDMMGAEILKIFPSPSKSSNAEWVSWTDSLAMVPLAENPTERSLTYKAIMWKYISDLIQATKTGDYTAADKMLEDITAIQRAATADGVLPTAIMIEKEVSYNEKKIFSKLKNWYGGLSLLVLILGIINLVAEKKNKIIEYILWGLFGLLAICFAYHTYGMALRWYLTGHAPWSNGYEALVTISFGGMLAGFIFSRYLKIVVGATALLAFFILMTAGHSQYDPELTNLQPVLKSYWLVIHVAVITISYGFFGLGFILALISLIISVFRNPDNSKRLTDVLRQLTHINEMTLIVGITLATIGTFLGGVWANESWGRYWGWDQKETWALAIVACYSFILHFRLIPGFRGIIAFNNGSLWGFGSVIMTFVGVNYYLSKGLHSYAAGDTPAFPAWVWGILAALFVLSIIATIKDKNLAKQVEK